MGTIVDRRGQINDRLANSRRKFLKRQSRTIRKRVLDHIANSKISDIDRDIPVRVDDTGDIHIGYNNKSGSIRRIYPGNKKFKKGDNWKIYRQDVTKRSGGGNSTELSEDDFIFILRKEELLDFIFDELCLPNFTKKSNNYISVKKYVNGGYTKIGVPARLAIKKTFQEAIARRIALKDTEIGKRFLDDIDLRYRNIVETDVHNAHAVMFCVMDVSASMDEDKKMYAKKFFLLLYLFLKKHYQSIEIRFIRHTVEASEVNESEFFHSRETGGTIMSTAFTLVNSLIQKDYNSNDVNIYVAQASDGDNWGPDNNVLAKEVETLLTNVQYMAYIEICNSYIEEGIATFYKETFNTPKLGQAVINTDADIFKALQGLFHS